MQNGNRGISGYKLVTPKKGTAEWRAIFLDTLRETANVSESCRVAEITRKTAYEHRNRYANFALDWDEAKKEGLETLEDEAVRRARDGVEKPVFHQGDVVGYVRDYSDTLLIFLLKAHDPARFNPVNRQELSGKDGGPVQHEHTVNLYSDMDDTQLRAILDD